MIAADGSSRANIADGLFRRVDEILPSLVVWIDRLEPTLLHIGESEIPREVSVITAADILRVFHDLIAGSVWRETEIDIILFKAGGGAQSDFIAARAIMATRANA